MSDRCTVTTMLLALMIQNFSNIIVPRVIRANFQKFGLNIFHAVDSLFQIFQNL